MKKEILAHCHVLHGQGKTAEQAYLILVEKYGNGDYCSSCIVEVFGFENV
jgi:hypothetical protein